MKERLDLWVKLAGLDGGIKSGVIKQKSAKVETNRVKTEDIIEHFKSDSVLCEMLSLDSITYDILSDKLREVACGDDRVIKWISRNSKVKAAVNKAVQDMSRPEEALLTRDEILRQLFDDLACAMTKTFSRR